MIEIPVLGEITREEFEIIRKANEIEVREKKRVYGAKKEYVTAVEIQRHQAEMVASRTVKVPHCHPPLL